MKHLSTLMGTNTLSAPLFPTALAAYRNRVASVVARTDLSRSVFHRASPDAPSCFTLGNLQRCAAWLRA